MDRDTLLKNWQAKTQIEIAQVAKTKGQKALRCEQEKLIQQKLKEQADLMKKICHAK